jgi:predicted lipase
MNYNKKIVIPTYFENVEYISNRSQLLMLKFEYDDKLYLMFAGTYPGTTLIDAFDIRYDNVYLGDTNTKCNVHKGFNNVHRKYILPTLEEINDNLNNNLNNNVKKIVLAGYSLGGALAILSLNYLLSIGMNNVIHSCYTFGTPKLGDKDMHDYYESYSKLVRIEYKSDIIPRFKAREFHNIGKKKLLKLPDKDTNNIIVNHYSSYEEHFCN